MVQSTGLQTGQLDVTNIRRGGGGGGRSEFSCCSHSVRRRETIIHYDWIRRIILDQNIDATGSNRLQIGRHLHSSHARPRRWRTEQQHSQQQEN